MEVGVDLSGEFRIAARTAIAILSFSDKTGPGTVINECPLSGGSLSVPINGGNASTESPEWGMGNRSTVKAAVAYKLCLERLVF